MSFFIKDDELLKQYKEIWEKVRNSPKKKTNSKPIYNEKYLKTKIKSYNKFPQQKNTKRRSSVYLLISNFA